MSTLSSTLAIQSWCLRGVKDHPSVIRQLQACGVHNVELCGYHLDPTLDHDYLPDLALYTQAGIKVSCFGVVYIGPDEAKARKTFAFAKHCGLKMLSADLEPGAGSLPTAEKLTQEYGIKLGIHNHGRRHPYGSPAALTELFKNSSPNIGLCLDTAWMLDAGYDPLEIAQQFAPRLYGLHIKDFIFDRAGKPADVVVGTGNLKLEPFLQHLTNTHWTGSFTLEYEGDKDNPIPALKACVEKIQALLAPTS